VPGDSAITRGDQIRKRNVYCRRRTRLSSFSEIIRLEEGQEEEGSFVWRTGGVFPRATDGEYVWSSRVGLNNITDSVLKAAYVAEQRTTGRKLQNARARARAAEIETVLPRAQRNAVRKLAAICRRNHTGMIRGDI